MGHDQYQRSCSSGAIVVVLVAVALVVVLGFVAIGGAAFFWLQARQPKRQKAMVVEEARAKATPDPRLDVRIEVDQEGTLSVDGEEIGIDDLERRLAGIKHETSNGFSVQINADPDCPLKHVIPVLNVCKEVGDIDFTIAISANASDSSGEF